MHINLHKTFSTPHAGGGTGSGPVVLSEALPPFAPYPWVVADGDRHRLVEHDASKRPFARSMGFHSPIGMLVPAPASLINHRADGLRQGSSTAGSAGRPVGTEWVRKC